MKNSKSRVIDMVEETKKTGLELLREPFPESQISKLPKPTKRQTEEVRNDYKKGVRCEICGGWHHPKVVHLDYVGHAALTNRLLDCDPAWDWEPLALNESGLPALDQIGGLWIKLTVCGQSRLGYGDADGKQGGNAIKEAIGDALRNAAMRFGAALDLWHKGDLHGDEPDDDGSAAKEAPKSLDDGQIVEIQGLLQAHNIDAVTFCKTVKVDSVPAIHAVNFEPAKAWIIKNSKAEPAE